MSARPRQIFATLLNLDSYFLIWIPKEPHEKTVRKERNPERNCHQGEFTTFALLSHCELTYELVSESHNSENNFSFRFFVLA